MNSTTLDTISSNPTAAVVSTTTFGTSPTSYSVHPPYPSNSLTISPHVDGLCHPAPPSAAARRSSLRRHSASSLGLHSTTSTRAPHDDASWVRCSRWALRERGESTMTLRPRRSCVDAICQTTL
ncbi:hypothetical protein ACFX16_024678 [Malus domestica]